MGPTIGVLALQGGVSEHVSMAERAGARAVYLKQPRQLEGLDGLIIPGGESTTIGKLLVAYDLCDRIKNLALEGFPVWGTCAGMILLARHIARDSALAGQPLIAVMPIRVRRNGFGRQVDSFEADLSVRALGETPFRGVFICAPYIEEVCDGVEVLAQLPDGRAVAARHKALLVTSFHPELTDDPRFHRYFVEDVVGGATAESPMGTT